MRRRPSFQPLRRVLRRGHSFYSEQLGEWCVRRCCCRSRCGHLAGNGPSRRGISRYRPMPRRGAIFCFTGNMIAANLRVRGFAKRRTTFISCKNISRAFEKCGELFEISLQACVSFFKADAVVCDELKKTDILQGKQAIRQGSSVDHWRNCLLLLQRPN